LGEHFLGNFFSPRVPRRENKRKAKFYTLTATGRKQLKSERQKWNRITQAMTWVLDTLPSEV
jgi:DNA-binding PadR family transcriptional regulator